MAKYNKETLYKGFKISMSVELHVAAERSPDGKVWHSVKTTISEKDYAEHAQPTSEELVKCIASELKRAEDFIDNLHGKDVSKDSVILAQMGFTPTLQ